MCKLDLKDAYLSIPMHEFCRRFLRFKWQGRVYEYTALPFGLSAAPRKTLKLVLATLRATGIRLVAYLDDILIVRRSEEDAKLHSRRPRLCCKALDLLSIWKNLRPCNSDNRVPGVQKEGSYATQSEQQHHHVLHQPHRGTHSAQMMQLTYSLWDWSLKRNILLSAEHLYTRQVELHCRSGIQDAG